MSTHTHDCVCPACKEIIFVFECHQIAEARKMLDDVGFAVEDGSFVIVSKTFGEVHRCGKTTSHIKASVEELK